MYAYRIDLNLEIVARTQDNTVVDTMNIEGRYDIHTNTIKDIILKCMEVFLKELHDRKDELSWYLPENDS